MNYWLIFSSLKFMVTVFATLVLVKYYLYLVTAPFYRVQQARRRLKLLRLRQKGEILNEYKPLVSVIVPAWNEEVGVIKTIKSVLANTYSPIEIVAVNDGSTDLTHELVQNFKKDYDKKPDKGKVLRYVSKERGGKGSALNAGIKRSKGEIIMTMDADSLHDSKAVENLVRYFGDPPVDAVVGNVKVSNKSNLIGLLQSLEYIFGFYFKRVHSLFNAEYIFGGACTAYRRDIFDRVGYFDEHNKTEDIELSMRTKLRGFNSVYAEDVITYTEGASTYQGLIGQRTRWKKGRLDTFFKYRSLFLSTDKRHSKFLAWLVLPYALLGEVQTFLEPVFFTLLISYTFFSGDYVSFGLSSLFIAFTFGAAIFTGDKETKWHYILAFPAFWLLFYFIVWVEFMALIKSLELIFSGADVVWQNWARQGLKAPSFEEKLT